MRPSSFQTAYSASQGPCTHRDPFLSRCSRRTLRSRAPWGANGSPRSCRTSLTRGSLQQRQASDPLKGRPQPPTPEHAQPQFPGERPSIRGLIPPASLCQVPQPYLNPDAAPHPSSHRPPGAPDSPQGLGDQPGLHSPSDQDRPVSQRLGITDVRRKRGTSQARSLGDTRGRVGAGMWAQGDAGEPGGAGPLHRHLGRGHTHSSAREASLSRKAPQTSGTILPRGPRGSGIALKGNQGDEHCQPPQLSRATSAPSNPQRAVPLGTEPRSPKCPLPGPLLTFVPSFPAVPVSPCSPGGPGGPG